MKSPLLTEIEAFLTETGRGSFMFGYLSVQNGRLVERLRKGGRVWPETEAQIRAFMAARSPILAACMKLARSAR